MQILCSIENRIRSSIQIIIFVSIDLKSEQRFGNFILVAMLVHIAPLMLLPIPTSSLHQPILPVKLFL